MERPTELVDPNIVQIPPGKLMKDLFIQIFDLYGKANPDIISDRRGFVITAEKIKNGQEVSERELIRSFQMLMLFIGWDIYDYKRRLKVGLPIPPDGKIIGFRGVIDIPNLHILIAEMEKIKIETGYEFHYFTFFNSNNPEVQNFFDKTAPTPETFELYSNLNFDLYEEIINNPSGQGYVTSMNAPVNIRAGGKIYSYPEEVFKNYKPGPGGHNMVGWSREALIKAVSDTGLNYLEGKTRTELSEMIDYKEVHVPGLPYTKQQDPDVSNWLPSTRLPKPFYEALYRKIFNTYKYIDWGKACQNNLVPFSKLQRVARSDFNFSPQEIEKFSYEELCSAVSREAERRRTVREELIVGIPEAEVEIQYQPGSPRVLGEATTVERFQQPSPFPEYIPPAYQELYNFCAVGSGKSRYQILRIAAEMGMANLILTLPEDASREEICQVLKNYIERTQFRR